MGCTITVGMEADGRPVAIKQGLDPAAVDRIGEEGIRLRAAQQAGVIELVRLDEVMGTLVTSWAAGGALAGADVTLARAASALAAAATAAVGLHERGLVHGRIDATHILLGAAGEAWLTGFAGALAPDATPHTDTVALAGVVDEVLASHRATRTVPARPGGRTAAPERLAVDLRAIAVRARENGDPGSDRELARLLREAVERAEAARLAPPAVLGSARRWAGPVRSAWREHRRLALSAVPVAMVVLGGWWWLARPTDHGQLESGTTAATGTPETTARVAPPVLPLPRPLPTTLGSTPATEPPPTTVVQLWPPAGCPTDPGPGPLADVDGDGCPEPIAIQANAVEALGHRYLIAADPDDVVLVGDWDCDGAATAAVLRRGLGRVEVFDDWPRPGEPATARPLPDAASTVTELSASGPAGCPELVATFADGSTTALVLA